MSGTVRPLARRWIAAAALVGGLGHPAVARASPDYPASLSAHLALNYTPACTICHTNNSGGTGTVTRPFGISMRAHGLVGSSDPALFAALDAMAADRTDSVCDGTPDIDDLKAGRDPNMPDGDGGSTGSGVCGGTLSPRYGCVAAIAPRGIGEPSDIRAGALSMAVVAAAFVWRRRRRQRRAKSRRPDVRERRAKPRLRSGLA